MTGKLTHDLSHELQFVKMQSLVFKRESMDIYSKVELTSMMLHIIQVFICLWCFLPILLLASFTEADVVI